MKKLHIVMIFLIAITVFLSGCWESSDPNIKDDKSNTTSQSHQQHNDDRGGNGVYSVIVEDVEYKKKTLFVSSQGCGGSIRIEPQSDAATQYTILGECANQITVKVDQDSKTIYIKKTGTIKKDSVDIVIYEKVKELRLKNSYVKIEADFQTESDVSIACDGAMSGNIRTDSKSLSIHIDGAGDVQVEGKTENLTVQIDGAANIDAEKLSAENARVGIDGTGNCSVYVSNRLDANVDGLGRIIYSGNPVTVNRTIEGLGTITAK